MAKSSHGHRDLSPLRTIHMTPLYALMIARHHPHTVVAETINNENVQASSTDIKNEWLAREPLTELSNHHMTQAE